MIERRDRKRGIKRERKREREIGGSMPIQTLAPIKGTDYQITSPQTDGAQEAQ